MDKFASALVGLRQDCERLEAFPIIQPFFRPKVALFIEEKLPFVYFYQLSKIERICNATFY